jgi:hypothetical protein
MPAPYNPPWGRGSSGRRASQADPNMRVSHAERTEVADRLSKHYGDGRLDEEEFNERLDRAMKAKTQSDLDGLFDDLPEPQGSGPTAAGPSGWTPGRIISVVTGAVLVVFSLGLLGGGAGAVWATTADRHGGYVDLGTQSYHTTGHALASGQVELSTAAGRWEVARSLFGTVRLRVTSSGGTPVFAGIAPAGAAARYLSGVAYATVTGFTGDHSSYLGHAGGAPRVLPAQARIWTVKTTGPGTQTLAWPVTGGRWTVVAMNANGSAPVNVRVNVAASLPALPWIATGLLIAGVVFLAAGALLITFPVRNASRERAASASG